MTDYFKLGVDGEGYAFFIPSSYSKPEKILGSGTRRTISGKGKRDIVTTKSSFTLGFESLDVDEVANLYTQFEKYSKQGKNLSFFDDSGKKYFVHWGEEFGINERIKNGVELWSGSITLEEV
ncbi:hypothetical protein PP655_gp018 [Bacillus phage PBC4]|uniref:Uncharacterized protein n=1 Tax=Bacillus phage PBC4 TaxID=1675028 RepID=A0A1D6X863_9CAUD|nr:hypothetical protein PP655_gp018 [Bacillus phage PBC4]AKQ08210.1 hypothetical protein PBC4_018 [Bacillus phage PBC4]